MSHRHLMFCMSLVSLAVGVLGLSKKSSALDNESYYRVASIERERIQNDRDFRRWVQPEAGFKGVYLISNDKSKTSFHSRRPADLDPITVVSGIMRIGKEIWELVTDNKPVLTTDFPNISGLPRVKEEKEWDEMRWGELRSDTLGFSIKNFLGMKVIRFVYLLTYRPEGKHPRYPGLYLRDVSIRPVMISVAWGFKMNAALKSQVINASENLDPKVMVDLNLKVDIDSPLKVDHYSDSFLIRADGKIRALAN